MLQMPPVIPKNTKVAFPMKWFKHHDERGLIAKLALQKQFIGASVRYLHPTFFQDSKYRGVLIDILVDSKRLHPELIMPGDVDMLIIPYTKRTINFSQSLAIEAKVIRASFEKQNKSPNQFGFSQAKGLLNIGFPYVAVMHIIVSDISPSQSWQEILVGTVQSNDTIVGLTKCFSDPLPIKLLDRALGRLIHHRTDEHIGVLAHYVATRQHNGMNDFCEGMYQPTGQVCTINPKTNPQLIAGMTAYYQQNWRWFLNTPRYVSDTFVYKTGAFQPA